MTTDTPEFKRKVIEWKLTSARSSVTEHYKAWQKAKVRVIELEAELNKLNGNASAAPSMPADAPAKRYEARPMYAVNVGDIEHWAPRDRRISKIELVNGTYRVWYDGQEGPMAFFETEPEEKVVILVTDDQPQPAPTAPTTSDDDAMPSVPYGHGPRGEEVRLPIATIGGYPLEKPAPERAPGAVKLSFFEQKTLQLVVDSGGWRRWGAFTPAQKNVVRKHEEWFRSERYGGEPGYALSDAGRSALAAKS